MTGGNQPHPAKSSPPLPLEAFRRFQTDLERRLQDRPGDAPIAWRLGETARMAGDLATAARAYRVCLAADPTHRAARRLLTILEERADEADQSPGDARPAPFLYREDFLSSSQLADLWRVVETRQRDLRPSLVVNAGKTDCLVPEYRDSLRMNGEADAGPILLPWVRDLIQTHDLVRRFATRPLSLDQVEVEIASHGDGQFFQAHRDSGGRLGYRAMTFVFYFFRLPKPFEGGDLLLHDQPADADFPLANKATRLIPRNNTLVIFPSDRWHQVLPVRGGGPSPLDGRWTVHGWFRSRV